MRRLSLSLLLLLACASPGLAASVLPPGPMTGIPGPGPLREAMESLIRGELDQAEQSFIALRDADPSLVAPWLGFAEVAARRNDAAETERRLRAGLAATRQAPELNRALGRLAAQLGDQAAMLVAFQAAQQARPGDVVSFLELAELLQERFGEPARALPFYEAALARESGNPVATYGRGLALARLGRRDEALVVLATASRLAPRSPAPDFSRAQLLLQLNRPQEALAAFDVSLAREPDFVESRLGKGALLVGLGRPREGSAEFERALALAPENLNARLGLALALQAAGDTSDAERAFLGVLARAPRHPIALNNLAWMAAEARRDLPQALAWAQAAAAELPNDPSVLTTLGWVHRQRGEGVEAERALARAVALQPNADRLARLGVVRASLGQRDRAMADLRAALQADPRNAMAGQELRRLQPR